MAILVAADFDANEWAAWRPALEAALPGETLLRDAGAARETIEIALVANPPVGALQGLPQLRFITNKIVENKLRGLDRGRIDIVNSRPPECVGPDGTMSVPTYA